jgi:hypothetical protein
MILLANSNQAGNNRTYTAILTTHEVIHLYNPLFYQQLCL